VSKGYFQTLSAEQRKLIGQKGGQSQRSPELEKAWADQERIRQEHTAGASVKELAEFYKIKERSMWRIVSGK
jgi:hypothetical protein